MKGRISALLLAILMTTMSFTSVAIAEDSGRQMDVDCSGYTFEDLFEYNNAVFMFEILDDWATSDLYANSWVNESRAAVVRDNLDSLFEGLPGGDDNWISTDERDAVRSIGAKCIADMYTRIGIREGNPHRGDVDWNDVSFVENGIGLDEVNLVPEGHPDERMCPASSGRVPSDDCKEVPTTATNNLEISMYVKDGETHNTRFDKLANSGVSNFTVAMNATNVTSATMVFTFPFVNGLRMADWTIEDNGVTNLNAGSITELHLPDGSVRVTLVIGYDKADYPMIRNIFFDMTTTPPETNDIPVWSDDAPEDNTIIPIIKDGSEVVAITGDTMESWASDDNAWGLDCEFEETGWSSRMNSAGELLVTSGASESGTAECSIVDPYGATNSDTHTWRFGQPALFSAVAGSYSDSVDVEANPTLLVQNLAVGMAAYQSGGDGPVTNINIGSTASTNAVSLSGMSPGEFMIHVTASSEGMLDWNTILDLSLEKKNTPPVITVNFDEIEGTQATWSSDQYSFSLSGTAIDPDGGAVTLSANMCGETTTAFTRSGANWDVSLSIAKCVADGMTQYDVIITATDPVNGISTVDVSVANPFDGSDSDTTDIDKPVEESGLPSIGMFTTIISMLGAALLLRRD